MSSELFGGGKVKKIASLVLFGVLLLSGCSSQDQASAPGAANNQQTDYTSAQAIIDDLAFAGLCDTSMETPDPSSEYGQYWKRDLTRGCYKGHLQDCSIEVYANVGKAQMSLPITQDDFYGEDYMAVAYLWGKSWSVGLFPNFADMDGSNYETYFRCAQIIREASNALGGEVMTLDNYAVPLTEKTQVELTKAMTKEGYEYSDSENLIAYRTLTDKEINNFNCKSSSCGAIKVLTSSYCNEIDVAYSDFDSNGDLVKARSVNKEWPTTFKVFTMELPVPKGGGTYSVDELKCIHY
jgi:hypothetical protein